MGGRDCHPNAQKVTPQPLPYSLGRVIHCLPQRRVSTTQSLPLLMSSLNEIERMSVSLNELKPLSSSPRPSFPFRLGDGHSKFLPIIDHPNSRAGPSGIFLFSLSESWKWGRHTCNSILRKSCECTGGHISPQSLRGAEDAQALL